MSARILNLEEAPDDPIERIVWLGGVQEQVRLELDDAYAEAYGWARFTGRLATALEVGGHSRKRVMAYTRKFNEDRGRQVRWGDGR